MPSSHFILCRPLLLLPPIPPSIRVFSNESTLRMRWPKYWVSALASFFPKKSQGWSPLEWTGWISLQSKGLSRVFSDTTVQKHQFFGAELSSQFNSYIHTWPQEKPEPWLDRPLVGKVMSLLFRDIGISNFFEEISSLSHSVVFLYFFALIAEEGFLISPFYSLELCIQMLISFLFFFAFCFSSAGRNPLEEME